MIVLTTAEGHTVKVTVSALSYVNTMLNYYTDETNEYHVKARNAAAVIWAYAQAADAYKTPHSNGRPDDRITGLSANRRVSDRDPFKVERSCPPPPENRKSPVFDKGTRGDSFTDGSFTGGSSGLSYSRFSERRRGKPAHRKGRQGVRNPFGPQGVRNPFGPQEERNTSGIR